MSGLEPRLRGHGKLLGKLRLDRGPLRWWLIVVGLLTVEYSAWRFATGLGLVMAGAILHVIAKGYLRPGRDYLQRTKAITTCGPYRFTRNPFYLANLLAELGLLCVIGRLWVALFYLPIWAWVYCETILKEERKLLGLCGEIYQRYCNQVPRFFPRPWHYLSRTEASGPRFSWANPHFVHGCEIRRALRLVSYPFLLRASAAAMALPHWTDCLRDPTFITFATAFVAMSIVGWSTTPPRKDLLPANHPDYGILG